MNNNESYIISVSLEKGIYCHIQISSSARMVDLHDIILCAFNFDDDHAHAFFMNNRAWDENYGIYCDMMYEKEYHTSDCTLSQCISGVGHKFVYIFDFGDDWRFQCKVLNIIDEETIRPKIIKQVGTPPSQYNLDEEEDWDDDDDDEVADEEPAHIELPEEYSAKKLREAYAALPLTSKQISDLKKYFKAFCHLYEIIPLKKAFSIYNSQNEPISEKDFLAFCEVANHGRENYVILGQEDIFTDGEKTKPMEREIIFLLLLFDDDSYESLKMLQSGKPYYVPSKTTLLKYAAPDFFEITPQYTEMESFLKKKIGNEETAVSIASEIQIMISIGDCEMNDIINHLEFRDFKFQRKADIERFCELYKELNNNSGNVINRGFSPKEIRKRLG